MHMILYVWWRHTCLSCRTHTLPIQWLRESKWWYWEGPGEREEMHTWPLASSHQNRSPSSHPPRKLTHVGLLHLKHSSLESPRCEPNIVRITDVLCPMFTSQLAAVTVCCQVSHTSHSFHPIKPTETAFLCPSPHHWELKNRLWELSQHPRVWEK